MILGGNSSFVGNIGKVFVLRSEGCKIIVLSVGWGREVHSLSSNYPYNSELSAIILNPDYAYLYLSRGTAKINNDKSSALEDFIKKEQGKKTEAIKDLQKAIELYRQGNKTNKVNELEIAIANLNLDL